MIAEFPAHIEVADLVPDPAGRAGHWYHPATDDVYFTGPDFDPKGEQAPKGRKGRKEKVGPDLAEGMRGALPESPAA